MKIRQSKSESHLLHHSLAHDCDEDSKPQVHKVLQDVIDAVNFIKTRPSSKCKRNLIIVCNKSQFSIKSFVPKYLLVAFWQQTL